MQDQEFQESESEEVSNDTIMSELAEMREGEDTEAEPTEEPEESPEGEEPEEEPEEVEEEEPEAEPEPVDDKTERSLERIHAAEKQSRTALDSERQSLASEKAEWADKMAKFEAQETELANASKQALRDPAGLLAKHGITDKTDLMAAARQLYALAADDATPEQKALAQRTLRDRDMDSRIAKIEAENVRLREEKANHEKSEIVAQTVKKYTDDVAASVSDSSPIVANMLKHAPEAARTKIKEHAESLLNMTGEVPDAADVIKSFEEAERKALSDRGYDPDQAVKRPEAKNPKSGEKRPVSLGNNLRTPTKPPDDEELSDDDLLAEMSKL